MDVKLPFASLAAQSELAFVVPISTKESAKTSDQIFDLTFGFFSCDGNEFGQKTTVKVQITNKEQAVIHSVNKEVLAIT